MHHHKKRVPLFLCMDTEMINKIPKKHLNILRFVLYFDDQIDRVDNTMKKKFKFNDNEWDKSKVGCLIQFLTEI